MILATLCVVAQSGSLGAPSAASSQQATGQILREAPAQQPARQPDAPPATIEAEQRAGAAPKEDVPADRVPLQDEIVVSARPGAPRSDPMRGVNKASFDMVQAADKAVTGPVARGYKQAVPAPVRSGLRNALRNLGQPVVAVNYLLQLKPGKSLETIGRLAVNSTLGVAGLLDVAKRRPFHLPHRANGFAYTLGYYGVKPGPYLYLPLIGPTTVRDLAGQVGDVSLLPLAVGGPFGNPLVAGSATALRLVDERAEADDVIQQTRTEAADPYAATRSRYLEQRQAEIDSLRGIHGDRSSGPGPR